MNGARTDKSSGGPTTDDTTDHMTGPTHRAAPSAAGPLGKADPAGLGAKVPRPDQVASLLDVRLGIDAIDAQIIALLGLRLDYVQAAAQFKADVKAIPAPERVRDMLDQRGLWAADVGLPATLIAPIFAQLIEWYIRQQIDHFQARARPGLSDRD